MFGNFSQHFVDVGEVITSQGSVSTVSDDAFIFTGAGRILLLDYDAESTAQFLNDRRDAICDALEAYIGKTAVRPNDMVNTLIGLKHTKAAISRVFDGVVMDTGSYLFGNCSESRRGGGRTGAATEYAFVDTPSLSNGEEELYNITDVYTLIKRGEKRKAADIVSFLCGLAAQIIHSTRGAAVYAPMSNYVYSAERGDGGGHVLIVNDPLGEGWKVLPTSAEMPPRGPAELLEYSAQLVANALFGNEGVLRMSVLSSGVITSYGQGMLTSLVNMGDAIEQVVLSEGHVTINYSPSTSKILTVSVQPELATTSSTPSILSWFNLKKNGIAPERGDEEEQEEYEPKHEFVCPFVRSGGMALADSRNSGSVKRCKLTNKASATWRERLLRLGAYIKKGRQQPSPPTPMGYKVRNLSIIVGDVSPQETTQQPPSIFTEDVANAAYALVDFEDYAKILPILDTGTTNVASFTVVGNTPQGGGHSLRVVRLLKKKPSQQQNTNVNCSVLSSPGCKWYELSPTSLTAFAPPEEGKSGGSDVYVYTPRCIYHCKTAYVHLFADGDDTAPLNSIVLYETDNSQYLRMSVDDDTLTAVKKPLGVVAVATAMKVPIHLDDDGVTARPVELTASKDRRTSHVEFLTEGGTEFMSEELVNKLLWTSDGESVDPPQCLVKRVDGRGKVVNMSLVRVDAPVCPLKQRTAVGTAVASKYPSPLDLFLIKYGSSGEAARNSPSALDTTTIANIVMIM